MTLTEMQLEEKGQAMSERDKRLTAETMVARLTGIINGVTDEMPTRLAAVVLMAVNRVLYTDGYNESHAYWAEQNEQRILKLQNKSK